jgi:hypothetical protein
MSSLPESSIRARGSAYVGFLRKPFSIEALVDAVNRTLSIEPAGEGARQATGPDSA